MGAVVRRDLEVLQRPALTVRQVLDLQAREKGSHARGGGTMVHVFDLGQMARRIGGDVRLQRDGEINDASWHLDPWWSAYLELGFEEGSHASGLVATRSFNVVHLRWPSTSDLPSTTALLKATMRERR